MRIIGGKHKGRKIRAPKHLPARPTKDVTKEALFNALQSRYFLNEISALDLFTGTGNIALEFASRGATRVTAVDKHRDSVRFVEKTARELDLPIKAVRSDVKEYLQYPPDQPFDVVFMDPPYALTAEELRALADAVFERGFVAPGGMLVIEHHKGVRLDDHPRHVRTKTYGHSALSFFE
ncbi:MAG: methyltransferase [Chlorobi bacterium]|nr:methyltransferase [Chlorobiota bacterium]